MGACCAAPLRGGVRPLLGAFGKVGDGYVAEVHRWATANGIPVRRSRSFAAASHEASSG